MDVEEFIDYMEPHLITFIKTSPDMEYLRKKGTTFYYDYRDKDRKHIYKFIITPSSYK